MLARVSSVSQVRVAAGSAPARLAAAASPTFRPGVQAEQREQVSGRLAQRPV